MEKPLEFEVWGKEHLLCHLPRALYRLKQACHAWYIIIDTLLKLNTFLSLFVDQNLYIKKKDLCSVANFVYVDGTLVLGNDFNFLTSLKKL